ncbi:MAG: hypothetical protein DHS20C18_39510 [Saprospiraceae bacterium]|nr:MAG: hypothetical protein DHS20C18_39510 [Saprospiraceae bacterium]
MKLLKMMILGLLLFTSQWALGQPYHIDKSKPEPQEIQLFEDPENETTQLGLYEGIMGDADQRFFIKGVSEFQPIDVFLFSRDDNKLSLDITKATWNDKVKSCKTSGRENYCTVKFRTYGNFGISISGAAGTAYTILAVVGEEVIQGLPSPFFAANKKNIEEAEKMAKKAGGGSIDETKTETSAAGGSNTVLYLIAFFLFLIVVLLAVFLFRKNKSASIIILFMLSFTALQAQTEYDGDNERQEPETEEELRDRMIDEIKQELRDEYGRLQEARSRLNRVTNAWNKIDELRKIKSDYDGFISAYSGLGDCIASAPAMQSPRVPSFCVDDQDCDNCFFDARQDFNQVRHSLIRLKTIYNCTIKMTDSAKAFGDSFSSATGTGLGWTEARKDIEESIQKLEKAYDKKYAELMRDLHSSMVEMAICEAQFGLEDWYDRFGFMYYEFMSERYRRN